MHRCPACGFEASTLDCVPARIASEDEHLDEAAREAALRDLRQGNFRIIIDRAFAGVELAGLSLLDVGCGHGWFLDEAKRRGIATFEIEPDTKIAQRSATHGEHRIRTGFFPEALDNTERFDIIVFNDVFEHLLDIRAALHAVERHLNPGGHLILNMPWRGGFFYRLAQVFARFGVQGAFDWMWQKEADGNWDAGWGDDI